MAKYSVYVFCNECGEVHPMGVAVSLDDGPPERESIANTYEGQELPPEVLSLTSNYVQCPNTGKLFRQKDNNQVFLVPIGD